MNTIKQCSTGWFCGLIIGVAASAAHGDSNWSQWRGEHRDGHATEQGLLKSWPEPGPERLWIYKNAGKGYSAPAVVGDRLYTLGTRGESSILLCLNSESGEEIWAEEIGGILSNGWGDGPRGTPSVDGDDVYALTGEGVAVCAAAKDGKIRWKTSMADLGGQTPGWGYTESVLVDGNKVLVTPGGNKGTVAALDRATGAVIWQSSDLTDNAHYSSMVIAELNQQKQYVQRTEKSLFGLNPDNGKVLWKTDFPGRTAVIPTPVIDGNRIYVTAGYGAGCKMVEIKPGNEVVEVYSNRNMKNHHGGVIGVNGHIYGYSDGVGWMCQRLSDGEEVWAERQELGKGAVAYADGMLICQDEDSGTVVLIEASTAGYKEHGRFKLDPQSEIRASRGKIWTHPVIANGKMYLRDQDMIYCYQVK